MTATKALKISFQFEEVSNEENQKSVVVVFVGIHLQKYRFLKSKDIILMIDSKNPSEINNNLLITETKRADQKGKVLIFFFVLS